MGAAPQTYIVAQNPLVLAHLLRENQSRANDPQAYTTPASVFNTVAVDFAETLPENDPTIVEKIIHPKPDEKIDIPLLTAPIPVASLQKLDPVVPDAGETHTVHIGARGSCDNLCQNVQAASPGGEPPSQQLEQVPAELYPSRVRSLERTPRGGAQGDRAPVRVGSLERNARGSLSHRGSPVPGTPFTRQHSVPASPPPRTRRDQDVGQFSVQGPINAQLAASILNKMRQQPEPPLVEEIYDFGGDNVKSCVAIAAQKALYKPQARPSVSTAYSVQGVPSYSQIPGKPHAGKLGQNYRSNSPQLYTGAVSHSYVPQQVYSSNVVQGAQPVSYRAQVAGSQASSQYASVTGYQSEARSHVGTVPVIDSQNVYASRQECSAMVHANADQQTVQVISIHEFSMSYTKLEFMCVCVCV